MKIKLQAMLCLLLATIGMRAQNANDIVDITSRFTYCWGGSESCTHNPDGSITFHGGQWGGMAAWIGGEDWSDYSQLVFELNEPSPVVVQPIVLYSEGVEHDYHYTEAGTVLAYVELDPVKRRNVTQVALQTANPATLVIKRIYLKKVQLPEYGEQKGQLKINELMQSNIDCLMDDLNDFPDSWIELYNSGSTPVNLGKYMVGLTDDAASAWSLPPKTIGAGQYVVVYADKVGNGLHAPFRLDSGKGAAVYLFFNGEVDDQITGLKKQPAPNIAYGRETESSSNWGYQAVPTPGLANCKQLCPTILGEPVFSEQGRVTTSTIPLLLQLSLPAGTPSGTVIRYTTDGSEPTTASKIYTTPLTISSNTVVRATLFSDGYLSPRSTTHSYIFFPRELTLPVMSLVLDQRYLTDPQIGIYANNNDAQRVDWRRPVNIEYFETADTKSKLNQLGETRVQGGATRSAPLKSLALYANKRFGTKRLAYEFFPDQRPGITDFKSLSLRNAGNDFDYLYMRDAVIQRTMGQHADLDWQAWRPAIVFENGVYTGIRNIRERSNEDNIYTHYDGLEDIDMIENWNELKEGDWANYNSFKTFYKEPGHTLAEYEQWLDCTEFGNLMLMNMFFNNRDFPGNNIVMWRPRAEGGRWRFIAKDTDFGLGLYGTSADFNTIKWIYDHNYDPSTSWANAPEHTILFRHLMDDADYRRQFIDRAAVYMGDFLNNQGTRAVWDPMYEMIKNEYPHHRKLYNEWWPNYDAELAAARQWLSQRTDYFYQHLADFYGLGAPKPLLVNPGMNADTLEGLMVSINGITLSQASFIGKFFEGRTMTLLGSGWEVKGWRISCQNNDGTQVNSEVSGALCSLVMPQCRSLVINAILGTSGIDETDRHSWSCRFVGDLLMFSGVEAGKSVNVYDVRGVRLANAVGTGGDLTLQLPATSLYIIKVGQQCAKVTRY